jgi:tetratricopeptide (TPR) repeat protein
MAKQSTIPVPQHGQAAAVEARAHRLYMQGLQCHHRGELAQAASAYEQVLALVPKHVEALHHVGIIAFQERNYELAAGFIRAALAQNPNVAGAHCDLGNALKELKQFANALNSYDRAIALAPNDADAYYNRGATLHAMARYEDALASYDHALALSPGDAQAYNNRGVTLKELGRHEDALASYDHALALAPDFADAWSNRGNVLRDLDRLTEALDSLDKAIAIAPGFADAYCNRGIVLQALNQPQGALDSYHYALSLSPQFAQAYHNRALTFYELERWNEALADSQQAIRLRPDYAEAYAWLGETLQELKQLEAAVKSYDVAVRLGYATAELHERRSAALLELRQYDQALAAIDVALTLKEYPVAHCVRGGVLLRMDRHDDALQCYERAIAMAPDLAEAHHNRAIVLGLKQRDAESLEAFNTTLMLEPGLNLARWNLALLNLRRGELLEGWRGYEWRWKSKGISVYDERREFTQPLWLGGEPLDGKTILLYAEQGLGDTLQMCRYVEHVAALGARIVLEVQPALVRLLSGLPGVNAIVAGGDPLPAFDLQCPLMSLPLAFKSTLASIPAPRRYLPSNPHRVAEWEATLGPKTKPRIGLVWSGSTIHKGDHQRSIVLADLAPLITAGDRASRYEFVSLQKEVRECDQAMLASLPQVRHAGPQLEDMTDTAALCELLDIVITVDTGVAHLAAALGRQVWIMLPPNSDWRWLRERSDSPWYPTVTLYRGHTGGKWTDVVAQVGHDLDART